jgi:hypothetical protein
VEKSGRETGMRNCVNPNDDNSISEGLKKLLLNPDLARKLGTMGTNGRHLAKKY